MAKHIKRILMLLMMAFIMIMATQKAYAGFLPNKCFNHNQYGTTMTIGLEDLESHVNWNMLCNQHGAPLVGSGANFYVTNTILCRPQEAFILSMMEEGINSYGAPGRYRPIQQAWYNIKGQYWENELAQTAKAYQAFVRRIAKGSVLDRSSFVDAIDDETGLTLKFPQVKDKKDLVSFNVLDEKGEVTNESTHKWAENVKVETIDETGKLQIGPFSIKYVEQSCNGVDFGAISGFDIYTDSSDKPVAKEDWEFRFVDRKDGDDYAYPHADEVFYILLKPIENATMLTKMDIDYKYLVAGGTYELLDGTFSDELLGNLPQQELALTTFAARWYKTVKIEAGKPGDDNDEHSGSLVIKKVALDENGKELTADQVKEMFSEYQYFTFGVKLKYADGKEETLYTTARAGESVKVGPISWKGDVAPTYEITELDLKNKDWKLVKIENGSGSLQADKTIDSGIVVTNQVSDTAKHENNIKLKKSISGGVADKDETFMFKVTVTYPDGRKPDEDVVVIVVPKGQITAESTSKSFVWYGDKTPTYEIIELDTEDSARYPNAYITPAKGTLNGGTSQLEVLAMNNHIDNQEHVGFLTVEKALLEGQVTADTFDFRVTVNGVSNVEGGKVSFDVYDVRAGEKIGPYGFVWKGDTAPTYTVEEINVKDAEAKVSKIEATVVGADGKSRAAGKQAGRKIEGNLVADGTADIHVKFTNDMTKHSGGLRIEKDIETTEKISKETLASEGAKFDVEVVIKGTFVHNGKTYQNTTEVIKKSLPEDGKWAFDISDIVWYGDSAPTYTVKETNMPKGWRLKGITYSDIADKAATEGHSLIDGKTVSAKIINELPSLLIIDLTFSMAGIVWVDEPLDNKNADAYYGEANGVYDEGETLKENTEVTVYKVVYDKSGKEVSREVAKAYKDTSNNEIAFPIITKSDGKWQVPRINVPSASEEQQKNGYTARYDVEFVYDGQTYEPTEFLSYQIKGDTRTKNTGSNAEKAKAYINAKTSVKDRYARDSMALATEANANRVITSVAGKSEINANGDSTGTVTLADGTTADVNYHAENAGAEYPVQSGLITTNKDGLVQDIFRATARTSVEGLTVPFDVDGYDGSVLTNTDTKVTDKGIERSYKFTAVYNYCLNINLGLKPRITADVALTKTLDNAKVVVKEKLYQYNYSGHFDLTEEKLSSLDKDIVVANGGETIEYQLGLYRSDYYYRAEMYKTGTDKGIYDKLENFYKSLPNVNNKTVKDTEMDIYLTYKIKLSNSSSAYDVKINSIDDYYDSSFSLVTTDVTKYLKTKTVKGEQTDINAEMKIAEGCKEKWETTKTGIVGTDKDKKDANVRYNKMTLNDANILLAPGEEKELTMTFKVNKDKDETHDIEDSIILGLKCNVAEIASYTTLYKGTNQIAGKIDRDSAPGNVSIITNNSKKWYEDDTMAAPQLNIDLVDETGDRTINGVAWEDNSKDANTENPGYNQQVGDGIKEDDEVGIKDLSTELVEKVMVPDTATGTYTEYDYTWPTSEKLDCLNGKTLEEVTGGFNSRITTQEEGKYTFNNVPAGDYVVRFTYGDKKIESADYSTAKYYNGQDYKSTKLIADTKKGGKTDDGYVRADSYLDIVKTNADDQIRNKAIDSEVRRLQVVEKSRTIDYKNGVVMAEYLDELFKDYYMFADTLKLDMNIEANGYEESKDGEKKYDVNHINCGLEERPITQVTLDKQIEEIRLTTSDGKTIMDAKYNIDYTIDDKGEITAKVELDPTSSYGTENLQALNRDLATNQGFRYINVDTNILEGTTIMVRYRFTAINTGEVDRTGWLADDETYKWNDENGFKTQYDKLATELATYKKDGASLKNDNVSGHYVGSIYYFGKDGNQDDAVVTTKVRQLVDYIDNDMTFDGMMNASANTSWSNVTVAELKGLIKPEIVGKDDDGKDVIVDENGVSYEATNRSNLVVSVDNADTSSAVNNGGFVVKLVPNVANADTGIAYLSAMNLTVTKFVGADSDDLQIDNIAEIIKYENAVGRRDELTVPGNQNPAEALETRTDIGRNPTVSSGMVYERDTSATEVITLSPPTGSSLMVWKMQVALASTVGLIILCGGIILIKKKVLK